MISPITLTALTLVSLMSVIPVRGQKQTDTRVLCERIASQCRETCQLYWDQCHPGQTTNQMPMLPMMPPVPVASPSTPGTGGVPGASVVNASVGIPGVGSLNLPVLGLRPSEVSIPSSPPRPAYPYPVITNQQLRPLKECGAYLQECHALHPCCTKYNCRFLADQSGFGRCH